MPGDSGQHPWASVLRVGVDSRRVCNMPLPTVAQYALSRLAQLGIERIFGVPGDYAFAIDDAAERVPGLSWVACANELNAAYAYESVAGQGIVVGAIPAPGAIALLGAAGLVGRRRR